LSPIEISWSVVGIIVPILIGGGLTFAGLTPPEFKRARFCFIFAAVVLGGMEIVWYTQTGFPFVWRVVVASLICLTIGIGLPETLRWMHTREVGQFPTAPNDRQKTPVEVPPKARPISHLPTSSGKSAPPPKGTRLGAGPDAYKDISDAQVGQWAIEKAAMVKALADECMKELMQVSQTPNPSAAVLTGIRYQFGFEFMSHAQDVQDLRAELLRRLGPSGRDHEEESYFGALFPNTRIPKDVPEPFRTSLMKPDNFSGSCGIVQEYAPYLKALGQKLKQRPAL
jgi:hypothetical protein